MNRDRDNNTQAEASIVPSGRVRFDDRGNAVWEDVRGSRLDHPALKLADELPAAEPGIENDRGTLVGYNPYQSGMLSKEKRRKTDLRALSKWIELQKRMAGKTRK